ncbi:hypothetical protein LDENG_00145290 [Lucifuga dentata]|nr:hypothetical protein LDENG_00145290 [Lucifuga dentata]
MGSVDLWCKGQQVLHSFNMYQGGQYVSSGDTVLQLEAGDKVWLQVSTGTSSLSTNSIFTGYLLFAV